MSRIRSGDISTRRIVVVSLLVDVLDIATNLVVAILTGSAVIFAEMAQGMADCLGSVLLVVGERRSRRQGDARHPLGYRREVFFWALLASMVMLVLGSGLALRRGLQQILMPRPLEHVWVALIVLVLSVLSNGYSLSQSVRRLRRTGLGAMEAFRSSGELLVKTTLMQDGLGALAAVVGLVALVIYRLTGVIVVDGVGALFLAVLMVLFSVRLSSDARELIVGRSVPRRQLERIRRAVAGADEVEAVNRLVAIHAGGPSLQVELDLDLREGLDTDDIERAIDRIQQRVLAVAPHAISVTVDLNSPGAPSSREVWQRSALSSRG